MPHRDHSHFSDTVMIDLMRKAAGDARGAAERTAAMCDCDDQKFKIYISAVGGVLFQAFWMLREQGDSEKDAIDNLLGMVRAAINAGIKGVNESKAKKESNG